jgi:hypothetical protein
MGLDPRKSNAPPIPIERSRSIGLCHLRLEEMDSGEQRWVLYRRVGETFMAHFPLEPLVEDA